VIKRQFGYTKVHFRGLAKHRATGYAVRAVESVDGAATFTREYKRGAPVTRRITVTRRA
jgi:hypothetical protein